MSIYSFFEWFANLYLVENRAMHIVGIIWFVLLILFTMNQFKRDIPLNNLKNLIRILAVSCLICYFVHIFFDLWILVLLFILNFGYYDWITPWNLAVRFAQDFTKFFVIYYVLSSPLLNSDLPTLQRIHVFGNKKLYLMNIVVLAYHLLLLYWGIPIMETTGATQLARFYVGYIPMKVLIFLTYASLWRKEHQEKDKK